MNRPVRPVLPEHPRLLVYDNGSEVGRRLLDRLRASGSVATTAIIDRPPAASVASALAVDVAALRVGGRECHALVLAAEIVRKLPWVELVFWSDGTAPSPSRDAARRLGISRLLSAGQLLTWLPMALAPLAHLARARRMVDEAQVGIPEIPRADDKERMEVPIPLPEAERIFREDYLRWLLSRTPNARRAAKMAGIPYTTLCSMVKKLGLGRADRWNRP